MAAVSDTPSKHHSNAFVLCSQRSTTFVWTPQTVRRQYRIHLVWITSASVVVATLQMRPQTMSASQVSTNTTHTAYRSFSTLYILFSLIDLTHIYSSLSPLLALYYPYLFYCVYLLPFFLFVIFVPFSQFRYSFNILFFVYVVFGSRDLLFYTVLCE